MTIVLHDLAGRDDQRFSANCWRSRFALAHKGLDYKTVPVRFVDIPRIADGKQKIVPVIEDRGQVIGDSWAIATYLEEFYADRPSLFGGGSGRAYALFLHGWFMAALSRPMLNVIVLDIHARLDPEDQAYFRASREQRFGMTLEAIAAAPLDQRVAVVRGLLEPARTVLKAQPFLSGPAPLYPDYLLAAYFMWARGVSPTRILAADDPLSPWFERMLDLHGGLARRAKGEW